MTFDQLSKETGRQRSLLHRYSKRGMPMTSSAEALAWIAANVRQKVRVAASPQPKAKKRKPRATAAPAPSLYQDARTRAAITEAEDRELALLERKKVLVHRDKVRAELARQLAGLKNAILQIPARLQAVLAAETDEAKVHDILQDELYGALALVAEAEAA